MQYLLDRFSHLVNPKLMVRLTDAMYSVNPTETPRVDELRDMFSSGQLISKFWMLERLQRVNERLESPIKSVLVVGGWYGLMSYFLTETFAESRVTSLDLDPRCANYIRQAYHMLANVHPVTADMYTTALYKNAKYDLIVNNACEHIPDVRAWLDMLPPGQLVALQSNSDDTIEDHINCPSSLQEFRDKLQLSSTEEVGQIDFQMYTRYMVVGRT